MEKLLKARAEHRIFKQIAKEIEQTAIQEDCPEYRGDREVDLYVRLSDVIEILQRHAPMDIPLLDSQTK